MDRRRDAELRGTRAHGARAKARRCSSGGTAEWMGSTHERAGSDALIHMHGELLKSRCVNSGLTFDCSDDLGFDSVCRCCGGPGNLRPHIVWFGEMPLAMATIEAALARCDLFVAIGTSGNVYPAAGFHHLARQAGAHTVELNLEQTGSRFDEHRYGVASQTVPEFLASLLQA